MYYTEKTRENLRFLTTFIISLVIHVIIILSIPKFYKEFKKEEIKEEKIRAGLVSLVEVKEKKLSTSTKPKKKLEEKVKKEEIKKKEVETKKISKVELKQEKTKEKQKIKEKKKEEKKAPILNINNISRVDRNLDSEKVMTTINKDVLRKKNSNTDKPVFDSVDEDRKLKGEESLNIDLNNKEIKDEEININTGNLDKVKIGKDQIEVSKIDTIDKNIENNMDIKGDDIDTKLPGNLAARVVDVDGGIVKFLKYSSPEYPEEALKNAQSGSVEVKFEIRGSFTIFKGIEKKNGYPQIDRAVELAAREWKFEIKKDGLLVNGTVIVTVDFGLKSKR